MTARQASRPQAGVSRRPGTKAAPPVEAALALLEAAYPGSSLGNKHNPLDELAYIVLSLQTNESRYQDVYRRFKARFPRWPDVLGAAHDEIAAAIAEGGLAGQKARHLKGIVQKVEADFGEASLRRLKAMSTEEAEAYLCSLPGVGIKTVRCVLMYSFRRDVFPADTHCLRVMTRLGWIRWRGERAEKLAGEAQAAVPPGLRMPLHIRLVQHGRAACRSTPVCGGCVLRGVCPSAEGGAQR